MKIRTLLLSLAASAILIGCNTQKEQLPPVLSLSSSEATVASEGGNITVHYQVENAIADAKAEITGAPAWIPQTEITANSITLSIDQNKDITAREAQLTITYPKAVKPVTLKIRQIGGPELKLAQTVLEVPEKGIQTKISYTLVNPAAGAEFNAIPDAEWVRTDLSVENELKIIVSANDEAKARKATVTLSYTGAPDVLLEINQEAAKLPFTIDVKEITKSGFTLDLTCENESMSYFLQVAPNRSVANCKTDEDFYQYDINFYKEMDTYSLGWDVVAAQDKKSGNLKDYAVSSLEPDTDYTIYVYGINPDSYRRITRVVRVTIKTLAPVKVDADFKIDITEQTAAKTTATISTSNYDGWFVAKLYKNTKPEYTDADVIKRIEDHWVDEVKTSGWIGYTPEHIIAEHGSKTSKNLEYTNLEAGKRYYFYVFAIDDAALRCSDVMIKSFVIPAK